MKISVIISSLNRSEKLQKCLEHLDSDGLSATNGEVILVYTGEDNATSSVMQHYASTAAISAKVVRADRPGLSAARNAGIRASSGKLLAFIDDDCHMHAHFINNLFTEMKDERYSYGGGKVIHFYEEAHTNTKHCPAKKEVPPGTFLPVGFIQGSNMFFRREIFEKIGSFREDLGPGSGTIFGAEDAEMVARASLAGYTGIMLPDVIVDHFQPKPWSPELNQKHIGYELGRGTCYAHLLIQGVQQTWDLWKQDWENKRSPLSQRDLERLQREFYAASEYIKYYMSK